MCAPLQPEPARRIVPDPKRILAASRHALAAAALLAAGGPALAADPSQEARALVETCLGCHGIAGYMNAYPNYHVPKLGGQKAAYIVAALQAYRAELRPHGTMHAQAATLSDEDMRRIAAWFEAAGNVEPGAAGGDAPTQAATCVACHGETGVAPSPDFPTLAGQYADYLARSLRQYKSAERQNPIMAGFAAQLSDEDIERLAAWYGGQNGLVTPALD